MKKQLSNSIQKKAFTFLAAFTLFFSSYATYAASPDSASKDAKASYVSYKGLKDDFLVFKVDYKNELGEPFQLVIRNGQNEVLYRKPFDARPLDTNILLTEIPDNSKLTFSIESRKKSFSQTFAIDAKVRTIEEYVVKGL
jgi:hypothetical protein